METEAPEVEMTIGEFFETALLGGTYEIETPQGWKPLKDLVKKHKKDCYILRFENGMQLGASDDHLVQKWFFVDTGVVSQEITGRFSWTQIKDINVGDSVNTNYGAKIVVAKEYLGARDTFDFEVDSEEHSYYSNGVVSHNTGKTSLGYILCNESPHSTVIWITPDIIQENDSGKHGIKLLYMLADFVSPSVIFLEDLDLFTEDRDSTQGNMPLGTLMNILDGVNQVTNAVTIATTNRLELIEKALSNRPGRFDRVVEISTMPEALRKKMFAERLSECKVDVGVIDEIVKLSDGWTGAQCQEFVNSINLVFIERDTDHDRHVTKEIVHTVYKMVESLSVNATRKTKTGYN